MMPISITQQNRGEPCRCGDYALARTPTHHLPPRWRRG